MYFGWEGVGLASYLLIGFWYTRPAANAAAIKAFIVNRVGDFGFVLGIAAMFLVFGRCSSTVIFANAAEQDGHDHWRSAPTSRRWTVVGLLLFIGAMGKSAQLGLHTWLPDAMEGPTPVSALIHAATMVTAGVFMVARLSPMFEYAPDVLAFVAFVGGCTAFFAATIGRRADRHQAGDGLFDLLPARLHVLRLRRLGLFAPASSICDPRLLQGPAVPVVGSVIHALSEEQDMRNMGGLWRKLPITYAVMCIGDLALAGIPFFAGYYSKDMILEATWASQASFAHWAYWRGTLGAGLTAFYILRLIFLTFHGKSAAGRGLRPCPREPLGHDHPADRAGGRRGVRRHDRPGADRAATWRFWDGSIFVLPQNNELEAAHHVPSWVQLLPMILASPASRIAFVCTSCGPSGRRARRQGSAADLHVPGPQVVLRRAVRLAVRPPGRCGSATGCGSGGDVGMIDGFGPDGIAAASVDIARRAMRLQTGYLYHYAFAMLIGVVLLVTWYLFVTQG